MQPSHARGTPFETLSHFYSSAPFLSSRLHFFTPPPLFRGFCYFAYRIQNRKNKPTERKRNGIGGSILSVVDRFISLFRLLLYFLIGNQIEHEHGMQRIYGFGTRASRRCIHVSVLSRRQIRDPSSVPGISVQVHCPVFSHFHSSHSFLRSGTCARFLSRSSTTPPSPDSGSKTDSKPINTRVSLFTVRVFTRPRFQTTCQSCLCALLVCVCCVVFVCVCWCDCDCVCDCGFVWGVLFLLVSHA